MSRQQHDPSTSYNELHDPIPKSMRSLWGGVMMQPFVRRLVLLKEHDRTPGRIPDTLDLRSDDPSHVRDDKRRIDSPALEH